MVPQCQDQDQYQTYNYVSLVNQDKDVQIVLCPFIDDEIRTATSSTCQSPKPDIFKDEKHACQKQVFPYKVGSAIFAIEFLYGNIATLIILHTQYPTPLHRAATL